MRKESPRAAFLFILFVVALRPGPALGQNSECIAFLDAIKQAGAFVDTMGIKGSSSSSESYDHWVRNVDEETFNKEIQTHGSAFIPIEGIPVEFKADARAQAWQSIVRARESKTTYHLAQQQTHEFLSRRTNPTVVNAWLTCVVARNKEQGLIINHANHDATHFEVALTYRPVASRDGSRPLPITISPGVNTEFPKQTLELAPNVTETVRFTRNDPAKSSSVYLDSNLGSRSYDVPSPQSKSGLSYARIQLEEIKIGTEPVGPSGWEGQYFQIDAAMRLPTGNATAWTCCSFAPPNRALIFGGGLPVALATRPDSTAALPVPTSAGPLMVSLGLRSGHEQLGLVHLTTEYFDMASVPESGESRAATFHFDVPQQPGRKLVGHVRYRIFRVPTTTVSDDRTAAAR